MDFYKEINNVHGKVEIDADGDVDIYVNGGYHGEEVSISYSIAELKRILKEAQAHKANYDAYKANDYEEIEMPKLGQKAKPNWGRNVDKWGVIVAISPEDLSVLIEFPGVVQMTPTSGPEPDTYWSSIKRVEIKD